MNPCGAVNVTKAKSDCPADEFSCSSGECLTYDRVCNEVCDCPDGSDEGLCTFYNCILGMCFNALCKHEF